MEETMNIYEAFERLELLEETEKFNLSDDEQIKKLDAFLDGNDGIESFETIIDVDAETEDELQGSYVGKMVLQCPTCHSLIYKDEEQLIKNESEEDEEEGLEDLYNKGEECTFCNATDGFKLIGKIAETTEEETAEDTEEEKVEDTTIEEGASYKGLAYYEYPEHSGYYVRETPSSFVALNKEGTTLGDSKTKIGAESIIDNAIAKEKSKKDLKEDKETIYIKYWEDEESRDQGISEIYSDNFKDVEEAKQVARKLVDRDGYASVEVFISPKGEIESEDDKLVWGYDGLDTWVESLKEDKNKSLKEDKDESLKKVCESYEDLDNNWWDIAQDIADECKRVIPKSKVTPRDVVFDDSRAWSLYVPGHLLGLPVSKFGAYRNYLGGEVRGKIEHNGRAEDGTIELGEFFASKLSEIEDLINSDYSDAEEWEKPTGVLENKECKDKKCKPCDEDKKKRNSDLIFMGDPAKSAEFFNRATSVGSIGGTSSASVSESTKELTPRFDSRQSFYNKAHVVTHEDGTKVLWSYNTPVVRINPDGEVTLLRDRVGYQVLSWSTSPTTLRHVKEFLKQEGKEIGSLHELEKLYKEEEATNKDFRLE